MLLGPAVSGANYEVPAAMADEVEAALPGSRTVTSTGTPGLDLRAGIAAAAHGIGCRRGRRRPAVHRRGSRRCSATAGTRRPADSHRWCGWNDRCAQRLASAGNRIDDRSGKAASSDWHWPPKQPAANPTEIELLPVTKFFPATDVAILSRLGCRAFGESREQEAAAKVAAVAALAPEAAARGIALAHDRSDPAQQGQVDRRVGAYGAFGRAARGWWRHWSAGRPG